MTGVVSFPAETDLLYRSDDMLAFHGATSFLASPRHPVLEYVKCSGFKSLDNFELKFKKGLNILVGPNGSGKTNIVLMLEFIGNLRRRPVTEAVSLVGGAGRIFRRLGSGGLAKEIRIEVGGSTFVASDARRPSYSLAYVYGFTISLIPDKNVIVFSNQRLTLEASRAEDLFHRIGADIEARREVDGKINPTINTFSDEMFKYWSEQRPVNLDQFKPQIYEYIDYSSNNSLLDLLDHLVIGVSEVGRDFAGSKALTIDPKKVREPEDIATAPFIKFDGAGFAATMFALQPKLGPYMDQISLYMPPRFPEPQIIRREIISCCTLVNDSVLDITVDADAYESQLRVYITFLFESGPIRLPISLVSDGTAKWLALVAAVVTTGSLFAIEEPENFLHPAMQSEIIKLVRAQFEEDKTVASRFALMTTHSETIINNSDPEELIVVELDNGRTLARRPRNSNMLRKQISNTGFGLGYFYARGAVE